MKWMEEITNVYRTDKKVTLKMYYCGGKRRSEKCWVHLNYVLVHQCNQCKKLVWSPVGGVWQNIWPTSPNNRCPTTIVMQIATQDCHSARGERNIGKHWFSPYLQATIENYIADSGWHPHSRTTKPECGRLGIRQGTQKEVGRATPKWPFPNNFAHPHSPESQGESGVVPPNPLYST